MGWEWSFIHTYKNLAKATVSNCKRCKNDGADSWACLNLFEAEIAFRLGEIHIYLKNHQIQTSEFQSFCDRWIVFSPRRNDDFLKKNSISRPHFPVRRDVYVTYVVSTSGIRIRGATPPCPPGAAPRPPLGPWVPCPPGASPCASSAPVMFNGDSKMWKNWRGSGSMENFGKNLQKDWLWNSECGRSLMPKQ